MQFKDKVCVITGCASGIGKHMAGVMARAGATVVLTDVEEAGLAATAQALGGVGSTVRVHRLDVSKAEQWESVITSTISDFGRIDILLNIAGISWSSDIADATPVLIDRHVDINLKGVMYGTHFAAEQMVRQRSGHIVNIASLAGLSPVPGMSLYSASKFGVRGFSLSIWSELKPHNVHVSVICPDAVATPMLEHEALDPKASMSFSGNHILTVQDIERAIVHGALRKKKLEVVVPFSMSGLTRFVCALPALAMPLLPMFNARGVANQAKYRESLTKK